MVECVVSLSRRQVRVSHQNRKMGNMRTKCDDVMKHAQAITHWLLPLPPSVSRSTGKSCCSVVVVSEGAKKAKKESISVEFGRVDEA